MADYFQPQSQAQYGMLSGGTPSASAQANNRSMNDSWMQAFGTGGQQQQQYGGSVAPAQGGYAQLSGGPSTMQAAFGGFGGFGQSAPQGYQQNMDSMRRAQLSAFGTGQQQAYQPQQYQAAQQSYNAPAQYSQGQYQASPQALQATRSPNLLGYADGSYRFDGPGQQNMNNMRQAQLGAFGMGGGGYPGYGQQGLGNLADAFRIVQMYGGGGGYGGYGGGYGGVSPFLMRLFGMG